MMKTTVLEIQMDFEKALEGSINPNGGISVHSNENAAISLRYVLKRFEMPMLFISLTSTLISNISHSQYFKYHSKIGQVSTD